MKSQEKRDEQTVEIVRALAIAVIPMSAVAVAVETLGSGTGLLVALLLLASFLLFRLLRRWPN